LGTNGEWKSGDKSSRNSNREGIKFHGEPREEKLIKSDGELTDAGGRLRVWGMT
jgi:hypothetical protein